MLMHFSMTWRQSVLLVQSRGLRTVLCTVRSYRYNNIIIYWNISHTAQCLITEVRNVHLQRFLLQLRIIVTIRILVFFVQDFHIILLWLKIKLNVFCLTFGTYKSPRLPYSTIYFTDIARTFRIYIITTFNSPH